MISLMPASIHSSMTSWMTGRLPMGNMALGMVLVMGRKREAKPASVIIALVGRL